MDKLVAVLFGVGLGFIAIGIIVGLITAVITGGVPLWGALMCLGVIAILVSEICAMMD